MKIVIALDSFKGCLTSREACSAVAEVIAETYPQAEAIAMPVSDGGEGLTEVLTEAMGGTMVEVKVHGPLMEAITARYGISKEGETAIMEMAEACGLPLVPIELRNPEKTTTYGFGEMIADALQRGCRKFIMGIGGSATCDAGVGMMEALGWSQKPHDEWSKKIQILVACDVQNPLNGPNGAAYVFAPQKGADPAMVKRLDAKLTKLLEEEHTTTLPGDGAAGGLGFALRHWLHAFLIPGIELVLDKLNFEKQTADADLIITGEGQSDRQTLMGKVPYGVLCKGKGEKRFGNGKAPQVILLSGNIRDRKELSAAGFDYIASINEGDNRPLEVLMRNEVAKENLKKSVLKAIKQVTSSLK